MLHCDLRVRWKVASDLRFRAAISEPQSPFFLRDFWRLAPSTRKSLAIAIVRFWCAKMVNQLVLMEGGNLGPAASSRPPPETALARFGVRLMSASSVRCACDDIRKFVKSYL